MNRHSSETQSQSSVDDEWSDNKRYKTVYVFVSPRYSLGDISEEDFDSLGLFRILVPRRLSSRRAAAVALGTYHNTMPLNDLTVVDFHVYNASGEEIEPDEDDDCYALAEKYPSELI